MPENKVLTMDDLLAEEYAGILAYCEEMGEE